MSFVITSCVICYSDCTINLFYKIVIFSSLLFLISNLYYYILYYKITNNLIRIILSFTISFYTLTFNIFLYYNYCNRTSNLLLHN